MKKVFLLLSMSIGLCSFACFAGAEDLLYPDDLKLDLRVENALGFEYLRDYVPKSAVPQEQPNLVGKLINITKKTVVDLPKDIVGETMSIVGKINPIRFGKENSPSPMTSSQGNPPLVDLADDIVSPQLTLNSKTFNYSFLEREEGRRLAQTRTAQDYQSPKVARKQWKEQVLKIQLLLQEFVPAE